MITDMVIAKFIPNIGRGETDTGSLVHDYFLERRGIRLIRTSACEMDSEEGTTDQLPTMLTNKI